jgi:hypothetical protein
MTEDQAKRGIALTSIVSLMKHADLLQHYADELSAQANALSDEAAVLANIHDFEWDRDVMPVLIADRGRQDPTFQRRQNIIDGLIDDKPEQL